MAMGWSRWVVAVCGGWSLVLAVAVPAQAQQKIYRCGNEYTNQPSDAKSRNCRLVEGGNLTVVEGLRPQPTAPMVPAGSSGVTARAAAPVADARSEAEKISNTEQRARDNDARAILEAELRKAETRHADLLREYNGGNPERTALELRNVQVYQERIANLKASIARSESDIAGIRRELGRLAPAGAAGGR